MVYVSLHFTFNVQRLVRIYCKTLKNSCCFHVTCFNPKWKTICPSRICKQEMYAVQRRPDLLHGYSYIPQVCSPSYVWGQIHACQLWLVTQKHTSAVTDKLKQPPPRSHKPALPLNFFMDPSLILDPFIQ